MKKSLILIVLCLLITSFNSCLYKKKSSIVKIGAVLPMTGSLSGLGTAIKGGLELSLNELNTEKTKYELVVEDVSSEQRNVISAYNKLKTSGIKIFVTAGSAYSLALKSCAIRDKNLLFCIASHPDITKDRDIEIFKVGNSSIEEGEAIVKQLKTDSEKIVVLYPNSEYGIPFEQTISQGLKNNNIILRKYDETKNDFKDDIQVVMNTLPDKIVLIGFSSAMGRVLKSIKSINFQGEIICNLGLTNSDVKNAAGNAIKGVSYIDYDIKESNKTTSNNKYLNDKYHVTFSSTSYLAYAIPFCVDSTYNILNTNLKNAALKIKQIKQIQINNEYPFEIHTNGDIRPVLTIKQYER